MSDSSELSSPGKMNNVLETLEEYRAVDTNHEAYQRWHLEDDFLWDNAVVTRWSGVPDTQREPKPAVPTSVVVLVQYHNRRAETAGAKGRLAIWQWLTIREAVGGKCIFCQRSCALTVEHWRALADGGGGGPDNIVASCLDCNLSKGTKPVEEWMALRGIDAQSVHARRGSVLAALYAAEVERERGRRE